MKAIQKYVEVCGVLEAVTGIRIGAGGAGIEIGGLDNTILRHPLTRLPYVPGSSLKGKLRSLLEVSRFKNQAYPKAPQPGGNPKFPVCSCNECAVCRLFGCGDPTKVTEPTRLVFRDCPIIEEDVRRLDPLLAEGIFYSEVKAEVTMDRAKGTVGGGGPRNMDRIIAGTRLDFRLTVRVFEGDEEDTVKSVLLHAFRLLEKDGLGASVSRGYGQVRFCTLTWDGKDFESELHQATQTASTSKG